MAKLFSCCLRATLRRRIVEWNMVVRIRSGRTRWRCVVNLHATASLRRGTHYLSLTASLCALEISLFVSAGNRTTIP
jgi:hypothetical protein